MTDVVCDNDKWPAWVVLCLSEPIDSTRPREDQAHQIPGKVTKDAVSCPFLDRHLTVSHLAKFFGCRLGILRSRGGIFSSLRRSFPMTFIVSSGERNNRQRGLVTVNGIASGVTMLKATGITAITRTGVLGMLAGTDASVPLLPISVNWFPLAENQLILKRLSTVSYLRNRTDRYCPC
jgi:hypothetical protein